VINLNTNAVEGRIPFPSDFQPSCAIAFNPATNQLYFPGETDNASIVIFNVADNTFKNIPIPDPLVYYDVLHSAIAVNPNTGRVYTSAFTGGNWDLATLNILTNTITLKPMESP